MTFSFNLVVFMLNLLSSFFLKISCFESANGESFIQTPSYHCEFFGLVTVSIPISVAVWDHPSDGPVVGLLVIFCPVYPAAAYSS